MENTKLRFLQIKEMLILQYNNKSTDFKWVDVPYVQLADRLK